MITLSDIANGNLQKNKVLGNYTLQDIIDVKNSPISAAAKLFDKNNSKGIGNSGIGLQNIADLVQNPNVSTLMQALPSSIQSSGLSNQVTNMLALAQNPSASNIFNATTKVAPNLIPKGSAVTIGSALNFLEKPSIEGGLSLAAAVGGAGSSLASIAGPAGAIANVLSKPTAENIATTAASFLIPGAGLIFGIGGLVASAFTGSTISGEQQTQDRNFVEENMDPDMLYSSGGESILNIQQAILNISDSKQSPAQKACHMNHLRCLIVEKANKMDDPQKKMFLDLANGIENNNHSVMGMIDPNIKGINEAFDKFTAAYSPSNNYKC